MITSFFSRQKRWIVCGCIAAAAVSIPLAMGVTFRGASSSEPRLLPEGRMPPKVMKKQPGRR